MYIFLYQSKCLYWLFWSI